MYTRFPGHRLYRTKERDTNIKTDKPIIKIDDAFVSVDTCDILEWIVHQDEKKLNKPQIVEQFQTWLTLFNPEFLSRHCFNRHATLAKFRSWLERNNQRITRSMDPYLTDFWDYHVDFCTTYLSPSSSGGGGGAAGGGTAPGSTR